MVLYENPHLIKQYGSIKNTLNTFYIYNDFIYRLENETQILILENNKYKINIQKIMDVGLVFIDHLLFIQ